MLKQKVYNWKDTNLFMIGSDLDKQARLDSAETERAWDGCGLKPELKVWRIEKFKVKHWQESKYGQFHTGDSYIILHTYKEDPEKEKLYYDIYFWIGDKSSQDEYGTAAYKTVELDAKFHDAAVQHREVQYHESKGFKTLFRNHVEYLEGGVESGFNHVPDEPESMTPELFRVKGTKGNIEFVKVPLRKDKLNSDDVFILDTWTTIFQWNGKNANPNEKLKAAGYLDSVINARGGDCKKVVLDEGSEGSNDKEFFGLIPDKWNVGCVVLKEYQIQEKAEVNDDEVTAFKRKLFRVSEDGNSFRRVETASGASGNKIGKYRLNSEDVFILDDGFLIWVWVGNNASARERGAAFTQAMKYIEKYNRPKYMPITQVREGKEPLTFLECLHTNPGSSCNIL